MRRTYTMVSATALLLLVLLVPTNAVQAQELFIGFSYGLGLTTGETNDYISNFSWRGLGFDWRKAVRSNWTAGFHIGWNVFNEETVETASFTGTDVTGKQFRYINSFPLLVNGHYYFGKDGNIIRPYLGGGIGAYIIEQRLEVGMFALEEHNWHFGLAPEGGFGWALTDEVFWYFNARYNYAFASGNTIDFSYWSFNIGIGSESYSF